MEILENKNNVLIAKNNNYITFFSYNLKIATFDTTHKILTLYGENWNYSQTTTKQFKNFVNVYTTFLYTTKKDFEKLIKTRFDNDIIIL